MPTDCPEDSSARHLCNCQPPVDSTLTPDWHRNCANAIALADEIHDRETSKFGRDIGLFDELNWHRCEKIRDVAMISILLGCGPVDSPNPSSEFGTQQA